MTVNEGIVTGDTKVQVKSEMLRQLARLKETTPDLWERAVFESLTGHRREEVDWDREDNQAGYYTWIRSFDQLIAELEEDGYVRSETLEGNRKILKKTDWDPSIQYSELVYPSGGYKNN
ncbi:MAG: hypothetical protein JW793_03205 [Acidobacteria bacterium]|nr:hypothetical protein [Acidobacteriota bacterium]